MFWAACTLGYFGFLRSAELTVPNLASFTSAIHLSVADIAVDTSISLSCLCVRIKASKTDPFRKGCFIRTYWLWKPLIVCSSCNAGISFTSVSFASGPLFLLQNGQLLSRTILTGWLWQIMSTSGIPGNLSSHSFHIGAATIVAQNGVPEHLIQVLG